MFKSKYLIGLLGIFLVSTSVVEGSEYVSNIIAKYSDKKVVNISNEYLFCPTNDRYILTRGANSLYLLDNRTSDIYKLDIQNSPVYGWLGDHVLIGVGNKYQLHELAQIEKDNKNGKLLILEDTSIKMSSLGRFQPNTRNLHLTAKYTSFYEPNNTIVPVRQSIPTYIKMDDDYHAGAIINPDTKKVLYNFRNPKLIQTMFESPDGYKIIFSELHHYVYNTLTSELIKLPRSKQRFSANEYIWMPDSLTILELIYYYPDSEGDFPDRTELYLHSYNCNNRSKILLDKQIEKGLIKILDVSQEGKLLIANEMNGITIYNIQLEWNNSKDKNE